MCLLPLLLSLALWPGAVLGFWFWCFSSFLLFLPGSSGINIAGRILLPLLLFLPPSSASSSSSSSSTYILWLRLVLT